MKRTAVLYSQHIGRMIKRHWFLQGKLRPQQTKAENVLKSHGYEVVDINDLLNPPKQMEKYDNVGYYNRPIPLDQNHPSYKVEPCFIYRDEDVLLEGLQQAKVLTNTVEVSEGLPQVVVENENKVNLSNEIHSAVKQRIMLSCLLEATQQKLPKKKDPLRPAWNFPREYGVTDSKKNELLCKNLVTICGQFSAENKPLVVEAFFSAPFNNDNKKIQFEMTSELVVTSSKKLTAIAEPSSTHTVNLPDIHPVECTVSINSYNFYTMQDIYPLCIKSRWPYIQTAFVHYNKTQIKNLFEEEVTESQIHARSLLKGFSVAVAETRAMYGNNIKQLPEPVVVPVVQTDGKIFHFTIFQLNTLSLDKTSNIKNIFWNSPIIHLYRACEYKLGRPVLEEYNPNVIRRLLTFYNMQCL